MVERKWLADGVMEIRLVGDDGELDAIVELTRPTYHALWISYLEQAQEDVAALEVSPTSSGRVLPFRRSSAAERSA